MATVKNLPITDNLCPIKRGDTFDGREWLFFDENNDPIDLQADGAIVVATFRKSLKTGPVALALSSATGGGISVLVNSIRINTFNPALEPGHYYWDLLISWPNSPPYPRRKTWIEGIWSIHQDVPS